MALEDGRMPVARILIVEDDLDNLELVRFLLEKGGFQVLVATNGREGFEIANDQLPDLILLDLAIPEIDGWSLAAKLRSNPATSEIKIVALTAHTLPGDRRKAFEAGCNGYVTKPLDISTFNNTVVEFLKSQ
jgi:CheY-like chemotaxis protein